MRIQLRNQKKKTVIKGFVKKCASQSPHPIIITPSPHCQGQVVFSCKERRKISTLPLTALCVHNVIILIADMDATKISLYLLHFFIDKNTVSKRIEIRGVETHPGFSYKRVVKSRWQR